MKEHPRGSFLALAGHAGALNASKECRLGSAEVVAVEAGDGEGLQDVKFDEVHGGSFGVLLMVNGLEEKKTEAEALGGANSGVKGGAECRLVMDNENARSVHGTNRSGFSVLFELVPL